MKTVLITGASFGLGASLARIFSFYGYKVIITYKSNKKLALKLKNEINCKIIFCDITCEQDIINIFSKYNIDILINNASLSLDSSIIDKSKDEFMNVVEVNLVGTFLMCKNAVINNVKDIINISSTDSIDTYQAMNIDYSCSKAGINILTKTFALEYKNLRIISILPNWIDTESVLMMDKDYLKKELKRIGQKKLLNKDLVAKKIYGIFTDKNIKSGDLIRIDEGDLDV